MNKETASYEVWFEELRKVAISMQYGEVTNCDVWESHYNDGLTPEEAIKEDLSYA